MLEKFNWFNPQKMLYEVIIIEKQYFPEESKIQTEEYLEGKKIKIIISENFLKRHN